MKRITVCLLVVMLLLCAGKTFSQSITLDGVSGGVSNDTIFVNQQVQFNIRMNAGGFDDFSGITNGFRIYSPDGAGWTTTVGDTLPLGWGTWFDLVFNIAHFSITGTDADTVGFGGAIIFGPGLAPNFNEVSYKINIGPIDALSHKKQICIDSSLFGLAGNWKWAGPTTIPSWDGPHCYTVIDPSAPADPSNIVLSTDFLDFTAIEGGVAPASQSFDVLTDQDPFNFTLVETASWLIVSPTSGSSGQTILTSVNTTSLTAGTYVDSIEVIAPTTDNSSQWVIVNLVVEPPPPTIGVSPTFLFFNAVAGEANPSDKIISIFNDNPGSSNLEWSLSNNESWLSLSITSGTNSLNVTVSIDITGLGFNEYSDTIVITDPNATNSPMKVPVTLSVSSDLPLIAVDSSFNYLIIPGGVATIPNREILIYNGGAGGMTYSLSESSERIFTLTPSSGTAPETVSVGFKITSGHSGEDFTDTLWVSSPEAINSPYPVVFHFHFVNIPGQIVMPDTVEVDVYECDQGAFALDPQWFFSVSNVSNGELFYPDFEFESDLFRLEFENNSLPEFVSVVANDLQLPLGSYYDTITVSALNAANSPQTIIVKYNVIPGDKTPEIALLSRNYEIVARANVGPLRDAVVLVLNLFGGCMEWSVFENIAWLEPINIIENVPGGFGILVDVDGFESGIYYDTLEIVSPSATNSPKEISFELKVWDLAGDLNWNGAIDITDIVLMVEFFFLDGAAPIPERRVGDLNCDFKVDITDVVIWVDFVFNHGPAPCGNP